MATDVCADGSPQSISECQPRTELAAGQVVAPHHKCRKPDEDSVAEEEHDREAQQQVAKRRIGPQGHARFPERRSNGLRSRSRVTIGALRVGVPRIAQREPSQRGQYQAGNAQQHECHSPAIEIVQPT